MMRPAGVGSILALLLLTGAGVGPPRAWSQARTAAPPAPDTTRPNIGLVLSGGGARGAAHVGVLKVLEELRIPVDILVGTSMGSIVGGLYASGLSPVELEEELLAIDWGDAFRDSPPREEIEYRRKHDDSAFLVQFQLGFRNGGFVLPQGLSSGQKLGLILSRLTVPVSGIDDFDSLSIPFRAVAADIVAGEEVILEGGSLFEAMRASMSVPGALSPYEIDGRLLVDGGLLNNLPVDVAKRMGADVIIAVDISSPYRDQEHLGSILGITEQVVRMMTRENSDRNIELLETGDILIQPDLGEMSSADFDEVADAVEMGEEGARQATRRLRALSVNKAEYDRYLAGHRRPEWVPPVVENLAIENESFVSSGIIESRIEQELGRPFQSDSVEADIARLFGLGEFQQVAYYLEDAPDGSTIRLKLKEKPWGPNYFRFGLSLADDTNGNSDFNLLVNHTWTQLNRLGGEWKNDLQIGSRTRLTSEFYQPLDYGGRFFVGAGTGLEETYSFETLAEVTSRYRLRFTTSDLFAGIQFGAVGELAVGLHTMRFRAKSTAAGDVQKIRVFDNGVFARFILDTFRSISFPREGGRLEITFWKGEEWYGSDLDYQKLEFRATRATTKGRYTLLTEARLETGFGTDLPEHNDFELGGFGNLSGYQEGEITDQQGGFLYLGLYRRIGGIPDSSLGSAVYLGGSLEMGSTWNGEGSFKLKDQVFGGSLFLGIDTILGPIYLAQGFGEGGRRVSYFFLGRSF